MSARPLEIRPLTPPACNFTPDDLHRYLLDRDPNAHLIDWADKKENPPITEIPGRPDLLLRWRSLGALSNPEEHPNDIVWTKANASENAAAHQSELRRLSLFGIPHPEYAHFLVPHDPYNEGPMVYTVTERLTESRCIPKKGSLNRESALYRTALRVGSAVGAFYLDTNNACEQNPDGLYARELGPLFQFNRSGLLIDLDTLLTRDPSEDLEEIQRSISRLAETRARADILAAIQRRDGAALRTIWYLLTLKSKGYQWY